MPEDRDKKYRVTKASHTFDMVQIPNFSFPNSLSILLTPGLGTRSMWETKPVLIAMLASVAL